MTIIGDLLKGDVLITSHILSGGTIFLSRNSSHSTTLPIYIDMVDQNVSFSSFLYFHNLQTLLNFCCDALFGMLSIQSPNKLNV